jgi:hypothetical protein
MNNNFNNYMNSVAVFLAAHIGAIFSSIGVAAGMLL